MTQPRVLVVDDNPDLRSALKCLLEGEGYEVRVASNGQEALECVACEAPHLILLDLRMPVMDGHQFFKRFVQGQDGATDRAAVVVVSGDPGVRETADALGADGYLVKPFDITDLLRVVARFVSPLYT